MSIRGAILLLATLGLACTIATNTDVACSSSVNCVSGFVCGSSGFCVPAGDAGTTDAGTPGAGADGGPIDAGVDAGTFDAGILDAGADAGPIDAGTDAGPIDAGPAVCGFDPSCTNTHPPLCGIACSSRISTDSQADVEVCDLTGHCVLPSYVASDGGTVQDRVTGLIWEQDTPGHECDAGFCNLADAEAYCADLSLDGYDSGWRLPTVTELFSLIKGTIGQTPALISGIFTNTSTANPYWTSDTVGSSNYVITFSTSDIGSAPSTTTGGEEVRCVHD